VTNQQTGQCKAGEPIEFTIHPELTEAPAALYITDSEGKTLHYSKSWSGFDGLRIAQEQENMCRKCGQNGENCIIRLSRER